ncbi:unnamed protein product [Closterium sp. NIES-65]|nr:unnamed protein product [Closterium sp. NIES-65]
MTGRRRPPPWRLPGADPPDASNPQGAKVGRVPALFRAAADVVAAAASGGGSSQVRVGSSAPRGPIYRSPRGRTHPHVRARGATGALIATIDAAPAASIVAVAGFFFVTAAAFVCAGGTVVLSIVSAESFSAAANLSSSADSAASCGSTAVFVAGPPPTGTSASGASFSAGAGLPMSSVCPPSISAALAASCGAAAAPSLWGLTSCRRPAKPPPLPLPPRPLSRSGRGLTLLVLILLHLPEVPQPGGPGVLPIAAEDCCSLCWEPGLKRCQRVGPGGRWGPCRGEEIPGLVKKVVWRQVQLLQEKQAQHRPHWLGLPKPLGGRGVPAKGLFVPGSPLPPSKQHPRAFPLASCDPYRRNPDSPPVLAEASPLVPLFPPASMAFCLPLVGPTCPCRSQPRRGPGEPGPSPAPSRLGAGWARGFLVDITRAAPKAAPFGGLGVSPSAWTCSCLLEAAVAAGIPTFAAAVVAPSAVGASPRTPVAADTAAASTAGVTGAGDADSAAFAVCSGLAPSLVPSASACAARAVAEGETEPASKAAAEAPADTRTAGTPAAATPDSSPAATAGGAAASSSISAPSVPQSVSGPSSFHQYSFQGPPVQHPWVPVTPPAPPPPQAEVPGQPPTLVEQRVMHVGTCLTLLSYVLDQLHVTLVQQEVQIGAMQPAEQTAAVAAAEELQHYLPLIGFVPGSPGAALGPGPGALARLAESAQEDPLDLVAAAASVLRWLDGRLCWILKSFIDRFIGVQAWQEQVQNIPSTASSR